VNVGSGQAEAGCRQRFGFKTFQIELPGSVLNVDPDDVPFAVKVIIVLGTAF
jgi:hypothetical protein